MRKQTDRIPPALKHGCYSGLSLLPTEDKAAFEKLHRDLIAEFAPTGRFEELNIAHLAGLMWRKQNVMTYGLAALARQRRTSIYDAKLGSSWEFPLFSSFQEKETRSPEQLRALRKEADEQAERELGPALELIEAGEVATPDHLLKELELIERLNGAIDRCIKQLLLARGVKSISAGAIDGTAQSRVKRVA